MNTHSEITQNLKDAGSNDELIAKYFGLQARNNTTEQRRVLTCHRRRLIDKTHENQKQIDCLDHLLHAMKKTQN